MLIILAVIILLLLVCLFTMAGRKEKGRFTGFEGFDIAHRGLHNKPTIPENSMAAFKLAVEKGYGIELQRRIYMWKSLTLIFTSPYALEKMYKEIYVENDNMGKEQKEKQRIEYNRVVYTLNITNVKGVKG